MSIGSCEQLLATAKQKARKNKEQKPWKKQKQKTEKDNKTKVLGEMYIQRFPPVNLFVFLNFVFWFRFMVLRGICEGQSKATIFGRYNNTGA